MGCLPGMVLCSEQGHARQRRQGSLVEIAEGYGHLRAPHSTASGLQLAGYSAPSFCIDHFTGQSHTKEGVA